MITWLKRFENWPKQVVILACIVFITLVGLIDFATGYETFFFTFYLLAIFAGTWRVGALFGSLLSALSVTAWVSANIEAGQHYSNYFIPIWNATIMFIIYVVSALLLALVKKDKLELEERVRLRTDALAREIQERGRLQRRFIESADREQRRIGRELHDGLCQHLTGTALAGHLLAQKLAAHAPLNAAEPARLVELVEQAIELTRNLSHELDPVELKSGELKDHFEDLAAGTTQRYKVTCHFDCQLGCPVPGTVATHLYRIAQEAVAGAVKRPSVSLINIGLDSAAEEIVLTVTDDGQATPNELPEEAEAGRTMRYRADLIGASLEVEHLATKGIRLTCILPSVARNDSQN